MSSLFVGGNSGSTGAYVLSGGSATLAGAGYIGSRGSGVLTVQGAGVLNVGGPLTVYNTPGSSINLSGGTINAGILNFNGVSSLFNWTAGTLHLTSPVTFDSAYSGVATNFGSSFTLGDGHALIVTADEYVGIVGTGTLNQTGGTNNVSSLLVASYSGSTGTYMLSGGSATVVGNASIGAGGSGVLTVRRSIDETYHPPTSC